MKVFTESRENRMQMDKHLEGSPLCLMSTTSEDRFLPHERHGRPIPPHERRAMMHVEFGEDDIALLDTIFGDPDTAMAAATSFRRSSGDSDPCYSAYEDERFFYFPHCKLRH